MYAISPTNSNHEYQFKLTPEVFRMRADAPEFRPSGRTVIVPDDQNYYKVDEEKRDLLGLGDDSYGPSPNSCQQEESYYYLPDGLDLEPPGLSTPETFKKKLLYVKMAEPIGKPVKTTFSVDRAKYSKRFGQKTTSSNHMRIAMSTPSRRRQIRQYQKSLYNQPQSWSARVTRGSQVPGKGFPRLRTTPRVRVNSKVTTRLKTIWPRKHQQDYREDKYAFKTRNYPNRRATRPGIRPNGSPLIGRGRSLNGRWVGQRNYKRNERQCMSSRERGSGQTRTKPPRSTAAFVKVPSRKAGKKINTPQRGRQSTTLKTKDVKKASAAKRTEKSRMRATTPPAQVMPTSSVASDEKKPSNQNHIVLENRQEEWLKDGRDVSKPKTVNEKACQPNELAIQTTNLQDPEPVVISGKPKSSIIRIARWVSHLLTQCVFSSVFGVAICILLTMEELFYEQQTGFNMDSIVRFISFMLFACYSALKNQRRMETLINIYAFLLLYYEGGQYVELPLLISVLWYSNFF